MNATVKNITEISAICQILNCEENQIKEYQEWNKVYFVKFRVGRPTFVSRKKVLKLLPLRILLTRSKREKPWAAKLTGLCKTFGFEREFLELEDPEFGRKGLEKGYAVICEEGWYHFCDGDYSLVRYTEELGLKIVKSWCHYQEVQHYFRTQEKSPSIYARAYGIS